MEAGQYEKALSWFYRVEIADPETTLKADVGSKIINCLERTGKYHAAEYALSKRASHEKESRQKGGKVAAEIAGEKIYLEDINDALDSMPEWIRKQFEGKEKKTEFLKKYVADELFYRKAIKLEYDKDPEVRRKLANIEKELLVNKVLEEEFKDKIKIEEDDLQNFFEAHKQDYLRKEAVKVSLIKAGMKEIADKITENLKSGKDFNQLAREISLDKETAENGGKFSGWVRKGEDDLGIGNTDEVSRVLFTTKKGKITTPVEAGGYYYIFRVDEKRPAKMPTFKESMERVKNDYYMQKLKISYQNLLDQILKSSEVKLYPEAVIGEGPS
jgi:parvulin-like peptidyl-prolyl isomerase